MSNPDLASTPEKIRHPMVWTLSQVPSFKKPSQVVYFMTPPYLVMKRILPSGSNVLVYQWYQFTKLRDIKKGHQLNTPTSEQKDIRKQDYSIFFFVFQKIQHTGLCMDPNWGGGEADVAVIFWGCYILSSFFFLIWALTKGQEECQLLPNQPGLPGTSLFSRTQTWSLPQTRGTSLICELCPGRPI